MTGSRTVKVLINTAGVHIADGTDLFASPITLEVGGPNGCGISRWEADASSTSGGILNEPCGFEDVNGDGIADRITSVVQNGQLVTQAALGTGVPDHPYSNDATITLPGPLARTETDLVRVVDEIIPGYKYLPKNCKPPNPGPTFDSRKTRGLRDINGDGIPDYIVGQLQERDPGIWTVAMGTGAGFAPPIGVNSFLGLEPSRERNVCGALGDGGEIAATPTGLYDIDGDGQPEIVRLNLGFPEHSHWDVFQLKPPVQQLEVGPVASVPAAGRLVKIDNGYGAVTRVGYKSAKEDTESLHNLPYPEIVVTAVATTDTSAVGVPLESTTHYAYRGAGLIFDSAYDAFVFPGYQRTVELRATSEDTADGSTATLTVRSGSLRSGDGYHHALPTLSAGGARQGRDHSERSARDGSVGAGKQKDRSERLSEVRRALRLAGATAHHWSYSYPGIQRTLHRHDVPLRFRRISTERGCGVGGRVHEARLPVPKDSYCVARRAAEGGSVHV
jgi:glycosyltransferase TcdB-like subunit of Tc toxin